MALLEMKNITKRFGDLIANNKVSFSVEKGEVHALLGENGAGKSTLMNILGGMYQADEGVILFNGKEVTIRNSNDAMALGIGMVHQHFMLIPALTVIENVVLGLPDNKILLDLQGSAKRLEELADNFGLEVDPWARVSDLTIGQQQKVEILKVLFREAKIIIFDEPTAVLTPQEVDSLFSMIRKLTQDGFTIVFISHKLVEIMDICDRCSILRRGELVGSMEISSITDTNQLASLMVGREVNLYVDKPDRIPGQEKLRIDNLCYVDDGLVERLKNVNLNIREGEILGICGVDGSGQSQLVDCIAGLVKVTSGQIFLDNELINSKTPGEILDLHVSHIPEDRHRRAIVTSFSINENLILMTSEREDFLKHGLFNWRKISEYNQALCDSYNVKMQSLSEPMDNLSGGNQQRVVVARELDRAPELLIAMHPSRGLDIESAKFIQRKIIEARNNGAAVLFISSDLEEIMEMSDRVAVMYNGYVVDTLSQSEVTIELLGQLMTGIGGVA